MLHPDIYKKIQKKQEKLTSKNKNPRKFSIGDSLFARNYAGPQKWISVTVVKICGPLTYIVKTQLGHTMKRHVNQLRLRVTDTDDSHVDESLFDTWEINPPESSRSNLSPTAESTDTVEVPIRRSNHQRRPIERFAPVLY
jgi:hypothetical protein